MTQPSRALLIAAGVLTQLLGLLCLVLSLASLPVAHDLKTGMSGVLASVIASLAAIVCGTLVWRGRLIPLALAAGLDVGFGIGLPRGGSAIGSMLRILPASDAGTAETLIMIAAIAMFIAAVLCIISVPSALKLRQWARSELEHPTQDWPAQDPEVRKSGQTLRGLGPAKLVPTQVLHVGGPPKAKPAIILGVAITLIAIGIIVITAALGSKPDLDAKIEEPKGSGSAGGSGAGSAVAVRPVVEEVDAGVTADAAPQGPSFDEFVERFHAALAKATPADLGLLFDAKVFAFGVEAHDLAEGRDTVVAQLREDLGAPPARGFDVATKYSNVAHDGEIAWLAEELRVGNKTYVVTAVAGLRDGAWSIAALHWAEAMPNEMAYRLAREGDLAIPDAIPDAHDDSPLANATRTAFASKPSFVEARSGRADAFNFGSASGERLKGGEAIKKIFGRIKAVIKLHDAVKVGMLGDRAGWSAANVDFTDADKDGTEVTQTFRVLAAWVKEDAGWRIVQTQWSNAR
ncbi:MAG TPA: nuclear transport factor 2 family protein [Kofleriaceae bacterium]|nr:nuclear transport factor 2 family protein [Kofleriaceae bacterium]